MTTSTAAVTRPALTDADGGSIAVARANLTDVAEDRLRTLILERVLVPGERIDILEFATALQVSRTPLLSALDRLQTEGLVGRQGRHNPRFIVAESNAEQAHAALATLNALFKILARDTDRQIAHNALNELASEPTGERTNRLRHDLVGICDRARNAVLADVVRRSLDGLSASRRPARGHAIVRRVAGGAAVGAAAGVGAGGEQWSVSPLRLDNLRQRGVAPA